MTLPEIGAVVKLYPAPLPEAEQKPGKPLRLRRVQDGAGNYRRFLPDEGAERVFDYFLHDRLLAGDVLLSDPRAGFSPAASVAAPAGAPTASPAAPTP